MYREGAEVWSKQVDEVAGCNTDTGVALLYNEKSSVPEKLLTFFIYSEETPRLRTCSLPVCCLRFQRCAWSPETSNS